MKALIKFLLIGALLFAGAYGTIMFVLIVISKVYDTVEPLIK